VQLGQYFLASGIAIGIQYACTILLSRVVHYLPANVFSILTAAVFNYLLNDGWTFAVQKKGMAGNPKTRDRNSRAAPTRRKLTEEE
jgi:putative flippase GtrA